MFLAVWHTRGNKMKLATSGKAILTKGDKVYEFIFDNSKIALYKYTPVMPANDVDKINDFLKNWDYRTSGLFVDKYSPVAFGLIVESLFGNEYAIEFEWKDGADPYKAWKDEQKNMPLNTVY